MDDETMPIPDECKDGCTALAVLSVRVDSLDHMLNGNGNPGFIRDTLLFQAEARDFFAEHRSAEAVREKKQDKWRFMISTSIALIAIALTCLFGVFAIPPAIQSIKDLLKSDIHLPHIGKQESGNPAYAKQQQTPHTAGVEGLYDGTYQAR